MATSEPDRQRIVVLGTGYVGLPAAIMLARAGHQVIGVDIDEQVVAAVNRGEMHIDEAGLRALMATPEVRGNLVAQLRPTEGDVFIVAVPTPLDATGRKADLSCVIEAVGSIVPVLRAGNLVIVESTIPPLTCRNVVTPLLEKSGLKVGEELLLAHCPERILPGNIFEEIIENDRVVGGVNEESSRAAVLVYSSFVKGALCVTDDLTAEMCKLTENTYRDVNVAIANELAMISRKLGIDVFHVIELANRHPRVDMLQPGIGVGGHCLPIDPWFIHQVAPDEARLISQAREVNDGIPQRVANEILQAVAGEQPARVVVLGVSYKPNCQDTRESPALHVAALLQDAGCEVECCDPLVSPYDQRPVVDLARGADCLALLVPHDVILRDLRSHAAELQHAMRRPQLFRPWATPPVMPLGPAHALFA